MRSALALVSFFTCQQRLPDILFIQCFDRAPHTISRHATEKKSKVLLRRFLRGVVMVLRRFSAILGEVRHDTMTVGCGYFNGTD